MDNNNKGINLSSTIAFPSQLDSFENKFIPLLLLSIGYEIFVTKIDFFCISFYFDFFLCFIALVIIFKKKREKETSFRRNIKDKRKKPPEFLLSN